MFERIALPFLLLPAEFPLAAFFWLLALFLIVAGADAGVHKVSPNGWLKFFRNRVLN